MISFYTRALLLRRLPPCWNKHCATRMSRHGTRCDTTIGFWVKPIFDLRAFYHIIKHYRTKFLKYGACVVNYFAAEKPVLLNLFL